MWYLYKDINKQEYNTVITRVKSHHSRLLKFYAVHQIVTILWLYSEETKLLLPSEEEGEEPTENCPWPLTGADLLQWLPSPTCYEVWDKHTQSKVYMPALRTLNSIVQLPLPVICTASVIKGSQSALQLCRGNHTLQQQGISNSLQ